MSEQEWISVDDRLPKIGVRVLAYWRPIDHEKRPFHREIITAEISGYLPDGSYSDDSGYWWAGRHYDQATFITHWQPLPEPPKEG